MAIAGENIKPSLELKILSGSLSGGLAAAVTSPIELIKVRGLPVHTVETPDHFALVLVHQTTRLSCLGAGCHTAALTLWLFLRC